MHFASFLRHTSIYKRQLAARFCIHHTQLSNTITSPDVLLSDENKARFLKCMETLPAVSVPVVNPNKEKEKKYAAVLIALCTSKNKEEGVSILYTKRSLHLSQHVRQISFPGGLQDHTDNDYVDCALRETEEEIGLPRSRIEILGTGCIIRLPSMAAIVPVIGFVRDLSINELILNPAEVEDAFTMPVKDLITNEALRYTQFKNGFSAPTFVIKPFKIWGVTGFITHKFLNCLVPNNFYKHRVQFLRPYKIEKPAEKLHKLSSSK